MTNINDFITEPQPRAAKYAEMSHNDLVAELLSRDEQFRQATEKRQFYMDKFFEDSRTSLRLAQVETQMKAIAERLADVERSNRVRNEMEGD